MQIALLYATIVLIWGSTWAAIPYQLGTVPPELSVAYRFALASLVLFALARVSGRRIAIPASRYPMVVVMGSIMFSANYLFVYYGAAYLTSGLVAVMFSLIVIFNGLFERLFFAKQFEPRLLVASFIGVSGIVLVFWPEVSHFSFEDEAVVGIAWVVLAVVVAALGNMTAVVNTAQGLPVMAVNAHAMAWGALTSLVVALILGRPLNFSTAPGYVSSLLFLAVFGSAIAFGCYLALLQKIGAARAAYTSVLYPIVALLISTVFEGYHWTASAVGGVVLILAGNWLALTRKAEKRQIQN